MKNNWFRYLIVTILLTATATSLFMAAQRLTRELNNNRVELVMDLTDLKNLSLMEGVPLDKVLRDFQKCGLTSVAATEDTLETLTLNGSVSWFSGSQVYGTQDISVLSNPVLAALVRNRLLRPETQIIISRNRDTHNNLRNNLTILLNGNQVGEISEMRLLEVIDEPEDLAQLGVGIPPGTIKALKARGMHVIPRLRNNFRYTPTKIAAKMDELAKQGDFQTIIFDQEEVLGYPNQVKAVAKEFKRRGINYGFVELAGQKGDETLIGMVGNGLIRVHSIPPEEIKTMSYNAALERMLRAAKDRSLRILFVRPFWRNEGEQNVIAYNLNYLQDLARNLKDSGFVIAEASKPVPLRVPATFVLFISLGIILGVIWAANGLWRITPRQVLILLALTILIFLAFRLAGLTLLYQKLAALGAAIIFPVLSLMVIFPREPLNLSFNRKTVLKLVFKACGITLLGVLFIVGILADSRFMAGAIQFTGIKIAFILPILLILGYFLVQTVGNKSQVTWRLIWQRFQAVVAQPVTILYALLILVTLAAVAVMLLRSGNTGMDQMSTERMLRGLLEKILWVRPRTKEFLVGYPFLLFAVIYYLRKGKTWLWLLGTIGIVSQISLANTFCHIHAPLLASLVRSLYGLVFGLLAGLAAYWVFNYFYRPKLVPIPAARKTARKKGAVKK